MATFILVIVFAMIGGAMCYKQRSASRIIVFALLFCALHVLSAHAQTMNYKGKIYLEAKVLDFESHQRFDEGTSHSIRTYHIQCGQNIYSVERHAFKNGDLMNVTPGDTVHILPEGKKMSVLVHGKESKYVIVGIKAAGQ